MVGQRGTPTKARRGARDKRISYQVRGWSVADGRAGQAGRERARGRETGRAARGVGQVRRGGRESARETGSRERQQDSRTERQRTHGGGERRAWGERAAERGRQRERSASRGRGEGRTGTERGGAGESVAAGRERQRGGEQAGRERQRHGGQADSVAAGQDSRTAERGGGETAGQRGTESHRGTAPREKREQAIKQLTHHTRLTPHLSPAKTDQQRKYPLSSKISENNSVK
jgi:hypothetical protein